MCVWDLSCVVCQHSLREIQSTWHWWKDTLFWDKNPMCDGFSLKARVSNLGNLLPHSSSSSMQEPCYGLVPKYAEDSASYAEWISSNLLQVTYSTLLCIQGLARYFKVASHTSMKFPVHTWHVTYMNTVALIVELWGKVHEQPAFVWKAHLPYHSRSAFLTVSFNRAQHPCWPVPYLSSGVGVGGAEWALGILGLPSLQKRSSCFMGFKLQPWEL